MISDRELLQRFAAEGSESAFRELVERHINVVYATALRRVGRDAHAADDVTQRVFSALARKAASLGDVTSLTGWLYVSTRFAAAEWVRGQRRRRHYEQEAHMANELNADAPFPAASVEPFLDEVLEQLEERDRDAILLHYFEGLTFPEVGAALSLTADAARMRVNRALERVRTQLESRGITSTSAALATALAAQSAFAAPATLAQTVIAQALQGASATGAAAASPSPSPLLSVLPIGGIVVIVAVALAVAGRDSEAAASATPAAPPRNEPAQSSVAGARETAARPVDAAEIPSRTKTEADGGDVTAREKPLLAALWRRHGEVPPETGLRGGVVVHPDQPNYENFLFARTLLEQRGWVRSTAKGGAQLTELGLKYCVEHAEELEQLPVRLKSEL